MKRISGALAALALTAIQAQAAGGFSCEAEDTNVIKLVIEGATPRSEAGLINFGGMIEFGGRKVEYKIGDVKSFTGRNGVIQMRATARAGEDNVSVFLNVRRNPKDEDDWPGTYEVTVAPAKDHKAKPSMKRGKVKCFVE